VGARKISPKKKPGDVMTGSKRPNPLSALSKLTRQVPTIEDNITLTQEINREHNDRGVAILIAANVENILQTAIETRIKINDGEYNSLFGFDSPIGTFENKIRIAYALEIIGKGTRDNIIYIKAIRNAFAHTQKPVTFETKEIKDVCDLLTVPELLRRDTPSSSHIELMKGYALSTRNRFINISNAIAFNLFLLLFSFFGRPTCSCDTR
jgi:hypothetical protein